MTSRVLVVGTGGMGAAHAAVLKDMAVDGIAVGRDESRARAFETQTGMEARAGGLDDFRRHEKSIPEVAVVCVPIDASARTLRQLIAMGVRRVLLEKPGAVNAPELVALAQEAAAAGCDVALAYNRRFYASVLEARRLVGLEGGVLSFHFEFTERESDALNPRFTDAVRQNWALANSSHLIDLAFFIGGRPASLDTRVAGTLPWHSAGSRFVGCGATEAGAVFSYSANWESAGRWSLDICTADTKLILKPLERLQRQKRGRFDVEDVALDLDLDTRFKPGLHRQMQAFLGGSGRGDLIGLREHADRARTVLARMTGEDVPG